MTKTQLVNEICILNPTWENHRGKLHYMLKEELERLLERSKRYAKIKQSHFKK